MKFMTAGYNQTYNLNPTIGDLRQDNGGVVRRDAYGLAASSENSRIIDTDYQAEKYGWTAEDKHLMERHLLSHPDFGRRRLVDSGLERDGALLSAPVWELYLAPGEVIPDEHLDFARQQLWFAFEGDAMTAIIPSQEQLAEALDGRKCMKSRMDNGVALRCPNNAMEGEDYCSLHIKETAEVFSA